MMNFSFFVCSGSDPDPEGLKRTKGKEYATKRQSIRHKKYEKQFDWYKYG
jgi:hypothetical protein